MSQGNGKLPAGWRTAKLGDLIVEAATGFACGQRANDGAIQLRMNNVTRRGELDWSSFIRVPIEKAMLDDYALRAGDVVFNNTNSTEMVGKTALFNDFKEPVVFSNHFTRLRTKPDALAPDFLALWLHTQWQAGLFARICDRWIGQSAVQRNKLLALEIPLPPLGQQRQIAARLREQLSILAEARAALEVQLAAAAALISAYVREDACDPAAKLFPIRDVLVEVTDGVGENWRDQPVLGATRAGLAPAKEGVGKQPQRYKSVTPGTIFYNPMRILLGSIALVDDSDSPGITSPDYVVMRGREGVLHPVWFYHWFRSPAGADFIKSLTRGAVRERLLFNRLARGQVIVPPWPRQLRTVDGIRAATRLRGGIAAKLVELEKLPAALLREAFSPHGEID
jgi:type I restriction enzyme, S subunit